MSIQYLGLFGLGALLGYKMIKKDQISDNAEKQQKVIIWTGIGSNGKSVCINFFQAAFGGYCGVLPITVLTRKQGGSGSATPELADTWGKRFVVFQEPENDDKLYIGRMKELSGSDCFRWSG